MKITLLDYANRRHEFDIGELNTIHSIKMMVVTGDEILEVVHKNYSVKHYDSCPKLRMMEYYDGDYNLYLNGQFNHLNDEDWLNRKTSYDYLKGA